MCRGKLSFLLIAIVSFSVVGEAAPTRLKAKRSIANAKTVFESGWSVGGGYTIWNEEMKIEQAASESSGYANYGGYTLSLERFRISETWLHSALFSYGMGKAVSGGFTGSPAFADGINRAWWATNVSVSSYRRLNSIFMAGLGLIARYRNADWEPKDTSLTVNSGSKTQFAGQVLLRWRITPHFTFIQAYTPLNFRNSTLWNWSANYEF